MSDMDMGTSDMLSVGDSGPLTSAGFNMSNVTDAANFLDAILDDSDFMPLNKDIVKAFWYAMVIVIGIAGIYNAYTLIVTTARLRAATANKPHPTRPSNLLTKSMATITAIVREASYPQWTPGSTMYASMIKPPSFGHVFMMTIYLAFLVGLLYWHNLIPGAQHPSALGIRAGWLTVAQLPLLILLIGKNNFVGFICSVSHERLNVLHRWVGRTIWLTATLHWAYDQYAWSKFGLNDLEKSTDFCYPTGVAAWTLLTWIMISSTAPIRNRFYELFIIQHIIVFTGFIVAIIIHIPVIYARIYVYIPIGLYLFDRLVRTLRFAYNNSRLGRATFTPLPGAVTKINIKSSKISSWRAGQHVFLTIPQFGWYQSHPATILSTPTSHDRDLVFILKAHKGFTSRIHTHASSSTASLVPSKITSRSNSLDVIEKGTARQEEHIALISGPYGASYTDFASFSSTILIAGSTGVTFTMPIFMNIAERTRMGLLPIRSLSFIWIVKSSSWKSWISDELRSATDMMDKAGVDCKVNVYVTCDEKMTDSKTTSGPAMYTNTLKKGTGCQCSNIDGPCCCTEDIAPASPVKGTTHIFEKSRGDEAAKMTEKTVSLPASKSSSLSDTAVLQSGRPPIEDIIWDTLDQADGETGIAVCGPLGLSTRCRRAVARISDERGVHKGTGAHGVYLHIEGFAW